MEWYLVGQMRTELRDGYIVDSVEEIPAPSERLRQGIKFRHTWTSPEFTLPEWFSYVERGHYVSFAEGLLPVSLFEYPASFWKSLEEEKDFYTGKRVSLGHSCTFKEEVRKMSRAKQIALEPNKFYEVFTFLDDGTLFAGGRFSTADVEVPYSIRLDNACFIASKFLRLSPKEAEKVHADVKIRDEDTADGRLFHFGLQFDSGDSVEVDHLGRLSSVRSQEELMERVFAVSLQK